MCAEVDELFTQVLGVLSAEDLETEAAKAAYATRARTAEFPNASIESKIGLRQFQTRGLTKTKQEALWAGITYNVQQWIRLLWRPRLSEAWTLRMSGAMEGRSMGTRPAESAAERVGAEHGADRPISIFRADRAATEERSRLFPGFSSLADHFGIAQ